MPVEAATIQHPVARTTLLPVPVPPEDAFRYLKSLRVCETRENESPPPCEFFDFLLGCLRKICKKETNGVISVDDVEKLRAEVAGMRKRQNWIIALLFLNLACVAVGLCVLAGFGEILGLGIVFVGMLVLGLIIRVAFAALCRTREEQMKTRSAQ